MAPFFILPHPCLQSPSLNSLGIKPLHPWHFEPVQAASIHFPPKPIVKQRQVPLTKAVNPVGGNRGDIWTLRTWTGREIQLINSY